MRKLSPAGCGSQEGDVGNGGGHLQDHHGETESETARTERDHRPTRRAQG